MQLAGDGQSGGGIVIQRQQAAVCQAVKVRHFFQGMTTVEPEVILHSQLCHGFFQVFQIRADAHNVYQERLGGADEADGSCHVLQILSNTHVAHKHKVRHPVVRRFQAAEVLHILAMLGKVGDVFLGHQAHVVQVVLKRWGGDPDFGCAVIELLAPAGEQPVYQRVGIGNVVPDGLRPQIQAVQIHRHPVLFVITQGGDCHGHRGELIHKNSVKIPGELTHPEPGAGHIAQVVPGQRDCALLPGRNLAAENLHPLMLLPLEVLIAGIDFSLRVIGATGQHRYFVSPAHQLGANLIDAELLRVIILTDDK